MLRHTQRKWFPAILRSSLLNIRSIRPIDRFSRVFALCAGLAVFPGQARSQDGGRLLTWDDCVALAVQRNPDLASSRYAVEAGRASYKGSYNGLLPRVGLSNSYGDGSGAGAADRWQAQASVGLDLLNAGRIAAVRSAAADLDQSRAGLRLAAADLRFSLRQAFARLLFAQKNAEVSRLILDMRRKSAQLVALRYGSGRESKGNMLRSKAQQLQAQADLAQSLRELRTAQKELDRQLGLDDFAVVTATGTLDARAPSDFPDDMRPFLAGRPDIAVQAAAARGARAGVSQARSALWPSLSASYARSRSGPEEFPSARTGWSFSGVLSYPLFGGGPTAAYFAVSAAKRNLERAEEDLRSVRNRAMVDLENAWSGFAGASDQVQVQAALLEAARQRNDEADIRYASGLMTYDNWEIIASDRIGSERQAVQSGLNAVTAEAAWQRALGTPLGE